MLRTKNAAALIFTVALGAVAAGGAHAAEASTPPASVSFATSQSGATSSRVVVGAFTYQLRLDHGGTDYATVALIVTAKPGVTGTISGSYRDSNYLRRDQTSTAFNARIASSAAFSATATGSGTSSFEYRSVRKDDNDKLVVTGSDGTRQTLTGYLQARSDQYADHRGMGGFSIESSGA